jgi:phosphatidylserine/phosphatidylglycerophosphate/cardiolipin synthase-like enzyme
MTMYELEDPTAEADLAADAARGVDVRILLDSAYAGAGANKDAAAALSKAGAHVRWAPSSVIVHQKTIVVDSSAALVMTANLTSEYYSTSADFLVEDRQPADVATIVRAFDDDWGGDLADSPDQVPVRGQQGDLVFSPGSEGALVGLIESARSSVETSNEEMGSAAVEGALEADARRGVDVEVLMTADSSWDGAFKQLGAAGVHVRLYPDLSSALYIHAKTIVVDGTKTYVGSINYSTSSMVYNRELGLITTSPAVTGAVAHAFAKWWASAPEVGPPAGTSGPTTTPPPGASGGTVSNKSPSGHYYRPGEYCPKRDLGKTVTDPYGTITCEEPPGGGQPRWTSTGPAS